MSRNKLLLNRETLIVEVTEALARALKHEGITKTDLSERIGCSKVHVCRIYRGKNMTLNTIADFAAALNCAVFVDLVPLNNKGEPKRLHTYYKE